MSDALAALSAIHAMDGGSGQLMHGAFRVDSFWLSFDGRLQLMDAGLSAAVSHLEQGSPRSRDPRDDVLMAGTLLYLLFAGGMPTPLRLAQGHDPREVNLEVSDEIAAVIQDATDPRLHARIPKVETLAQRFDEALASVGGAATTVQVKRWLCTLFPTNHPLVGALRAVLAPLGAGQGLPTNEGPIISNPRLNPLRTPAGRGPLLAPPPPPPPQPLVPILPVPVPQIANATVTDTSPSVASGLQGSEHGSLPVAAPTLRQATKKGRSLAGAALLALGGMGAGGAAVYFMTVKQPPSTAPSASERSTDVGKESTPLSPQLPSPAPEVSSPAKHRAFAAKPAPDRLKARPSPERAKTPERKPTLTPDSSAEDAATLTLSVTPWAHVWVDGRKIGKTPVPPLKLRPGKHTIKLEHPEWRVTRTETVDMQAGMAGELSVTFTPPPGR
jgi:hypothetical protein